ncbi:MAG: TolC family outer membrane protein, partial [Magnetococcales bacterium]|nr:TolC family outer membrane protein [Magnetococcales bacterium]
MIIALSQTMARLVTCLAAVIRRCSSRAPGGAIRKRSALPVVGWFLPILMLVCAPLALGQTLVEAVRKSLEESPRLQAARQTLKSAEQKRKGAAAGYWPSLDLSLGYGQEWSNTTTTRPANGEIWLERGESGLSLNQTVFDGFATRSQVRAAESTVAAERAALDETAETVALETIEAYLGVLERQEALALLREQRELMGNIHARVREMETLGLGTRVDVIQAQSRVQTVDSDLVAAQGALREAQTLLSRYLRESPAGLARPELPVGLIPDREETILEQALGRAATLRRSLHQLEAAKARHRGQKADLWPQMSFNLDYANNDNVSGVRSYSENLKAMMQVTFNLFNGGAHAAGIAEGAEQVGYQQALLDEARDGKTVEARTAWSLHRSSRERLGHLKNSLEGSRRVVAAYHEQFRMGQRPLLDVLNAENELFGSKRTLLTEEVNVLRTGYRLLGAMGTLLAALDPPPAPTTAPPPPTAAPPPPPPPP